MAAHEIGAYSVGDLNGHVVAHPEGNTRAEPDLAVDLGSFTLRAAGPDGLSRLSATVFPGRGFEALDEDLTGMADERSGSPAHRELGRRADAFRAGACFLGIHLMVEIVGASALLARESEDPYPVELCRGHEVVDGGRVRLPLSRKAEYESRPHTGQRVPVSDPSDHALEARPAPPAAHTLENRRRNVLQGEVEVGDDHLRAEHRVYQLVAHPLGMEVHETQPSQPVDSFQSAKERGKVALAGVAAPHDRVLTHQGKLRHPLGDEAAGFRFDVGRSARTQPSPHQRDGAEGAAPVAALRDLEIRPG